MSGHLPGLGTAHPAVPTPADESATTTGATETTPKASTEADVSPYGRAPCSVCGREMNLRKDGTVRHHGGEYGGIWNRRAYRCDGSGLPPRPPRRQATA